MKQKGTRYKKTIHKKKKRRWACDVIVGCNIFYIVYDCFRILNIRIIIICNSIVTIVIVVIIIYWNGAAGGGCGGDIINIIIIITL